MDEDYLLATVRYVERNPVAAKMCVSPEEWKWSSAQAHISGGDDELVSVQPMLERVRDWNAYLAAANRPQRDQLIGQHSRTGRPLGSNEFVRELERITGETLAPKKPGRKTVSI
jgi:putative transposase